MPTHQTTCPLDCPDACGMLVETDENGRFARIAGNPAHSYSKGSLCGKTALYGELVISEERLVHPLVRRDGELLPASWDEALDVIAASVKGLDGDRVLGLDYGGNMGTVARRFPRRVLNAIGAAAHDTGICDHTSTTAYECVLGRVYGADLEAIEDADLVVIWGADIARTVQHIQPAIQRMAKRGVPVYVIDVYRTESMRRVEAWGGTGLIVRPGSDAALALGLTRRFYEGEHVDRARIERDCQGASEYEAHVRAAHEPDWVCDKTGLSRAEFDAFAQALLRAERPFLKAGIGWTRRRNGIMGMRALCSFVAVAGHEAGFHYESFDHFDFETDIVERPDFLPKKQRIVHHVQLGQLLERGELDAVFVWCHNPAVTLPDTQRIRAGLARDDVFVCVHEQFLTETAELADVVLPAANFLEQTDVFRSFGSRVAQFSRAALTPPGEARTNVDAFAAIGERLGLPREVWECDAEKLCLDLIEASRSRFTAAEHRALLDGDPVKLAEQAQRERGTPSGKVELKSSTAEHPFATWIEDDDAGVGAPDRGAFTLVCAPSRATHNSTFLHSARHRAKAGPPTCWLHPDDAEQLGVEQNVRLTNERGRVTLAAKTTQDMPRGLVRVDGLFRAQDVPENVGLNSLVASTLSEQALASTLYSTRVDVEAAKEGGA